MPVTLLDDRMLRPMSHRNQSGEWDEVMDVVRRAVDVVAAVSPRVSLVLKADIRPGRTGEMQGKLDRLEQALETPDRPAG